MRHRSARVLVRAAAVVAGWFAFDYLCVQPFRGNMALGDVYEHSVISESRDPQQAAALARRNLTDLDRLARSCRLDPTWYLLYASNCEILQRWPEASDAYTRALRIDDRPEIYFERGLVMLHLGRMDAAVADLATAARFNPNVLNGIDGQLRARVAAAAGVR
jgi:tetratricopeptide (TPR) repeat protein